MLRDQGYEVIESNTLVCLNNTWDQEQPKCTIRDKIDNLFSMMSYFRQHELG